MEGFQLNIGDYSTALILREGLRINEIVRARENVLRASLEKSLPDSRATSKTWFCCNLAV